MDTEIFESVRGLTGDEINLDKCATMSGVHLTADDHLSPNSLASWV